MALWEVPGCRRGREVPRQTRRPGRLRSLEAGPRPRDELLRAAASLSPEVLPLHGTLRSVVWGRRGERRVRGPARCARAAPLGAPPSPLRGGAHEDHFAHDDPEVGVVFRDPRPVRGVQPAREQESAGLPHAPVCGAPGYPASLEQAPGPSSLGPRGHCKQLLRWRSNPSGSDPAGPQSPLQPSLPRQGSPLARRAPPLGQPRAHLGTGVLRARTCLALAGPGLGALRGCRFRVCPTRLP